MEKLILSGLCMLLLVSIAYADGQYKQGYFDNEVVVIHLNESSGTVAEDVSIYGNNGTLVNTPSWVDGKYGNGLLFDGGSDRAVTFPAYTFKGNGRNETGSVCYWFNSTDNSALKVVWFGGEGGTYCGVGSPANAIICTLRNSAGTQIDIDSDNVISTYSWHHVCVTWETVTQKVATLYLNGTNVSQATLDGFQLDNDGDSMLGVYDVSAFDFVGVIDEFLFFNDTLTSAEVNKLWLGTAQPAADTCTPPATGNYDVTASDNCHWTENDEIPGNISITGDGNLTLGANWTFTSSNQYIFIDGTVIFAITSGGSFNG